MNNHQSGKSDQPQPQDFDSIIFTSPIRLLVMILVLKHGSITLKELVKLVNTTPGNLDHHIKYLEEANYVHKYSTKSQTRLLYSVKLTELGNEKIQSQLGNLKKLIKDNNL